MKDDFCSVESCKYNLLALVVGILILQLWINYKIVSSSIWINIEMLIADIKSLTVFVLYRKMPFFLFFLFLEELIF